MIEDSALHRLNTSLRYQPTWATMVHATLGPELFAVDVLSDSSPLRLRNSNQKTGPTCCSTPRPPAHRSTRFSTNCSTLGFNAVSCNLKSSTVPMRRTLIPGYPELTRFMSVPHVLQK